MKPSERLLLARKLIENPKHWTKDVIARDSKGNKCASRDSRAVCWCAAGALIKFPGDSEDALEMLSIAAQDVFKRQLTMVNDEMGHAAVMDTYAAAIDMAIRAES